MSRNAFGTIERAQLRADAQQDQSRTERSTASAFSEKEHAACAAADAQLVSALDRHAAVIEAETPELREIATLAYRALEDAYRVISTIDGDDTHEKFELDLLSKRVRDIASSLFVVLRYPRVGDGYTAGKS